MVDGPQTETMTGTRPQLRRLAAVLWQIGWLAVVVSGWVLGLTLLFLATGWPRWAFYVAVIGGAIGYAQLFDP